MSDSKAQNQQTEGHNNGYKYIVEKESGQVIHRNNLNSTTTTPKKTHLVFGFIHITVTILLTYAILSTVTGRTSVSTISLLLHILFLIISVYAAIDSFLMYFRETTIIQFLLANRS